MSKLPAKMGRGASTWLAAQAIANEIMKVSTNRDEPYVDRIKREFNLHDYSQARALYDSDPSYWEGLYGNDPLNSSHHPPSRRLVCYHASGQRGIRATTISIRSQRMPAHSVVSVPAGNFRLDQRRRRNRSTRRNHSSHHLTVLGRLRGAMDRLLVVSFVSRSQARSKMRSRLERRLCRSLREARCLAPARSLRSKSAFQRPLRRRVRLRTR